MQEEYLRDIHSSSKHLLSLINDILDLAKVEAGKMELELSSIELKHLLEKSLVMVKEKALAHSIELSTDFNGIPQFIKADERKLKQIVFNLLSNAVKFTPDKGKIHLKAYKKILSSFNNRPKEIVEISVSDTGLGIDSHLKKRIFDAFEQAGETTTRGYQGTGLGLALTKSLVELHGGEIWVESEGKGQGSTFTFNIPV
jgi:signal transduction histidine kinase